MDNSLFAVHIYSNRLFEFSLPNLLDINCCNVIDFKHLTGITSKCNIEHVVKGKFLGTSSRLLSQAGMGKEGEASPLGMLNEHSAFFLASERSSAETFNNAF